MDVIIDRVASGNTFRGRVWMPVMAFPSNLELTHVHLNTQSPSSIAFMKTEVNSAAKFIMCP